LLLHRFLGAFAPGYRQSPPLGAPSRSAAVRGGPQAVELLCVGYIPSATLQQGDSRRFGGLPATRENFSSDKLIGDAMDSTMQDTVVFYNSITVALTIGALIALAVMLVSFVAMIVRWKTPHRRRHAIRLAVAFAAIPCLIGIQQAILWFVLLPALGREQMAEFHAARAMQLAETTLVHVGDPSPPFALTTIDGDDFSLAGAAGDVVLLNFFATWCGPCQLELPHIEEIWTARKHDANFRLLVIGREETTETAKAYREAKGFTFPIAADPDRAVFSLFATESIPRTLVISPEGVIVYSTTGFYEADLDELNTLLDAQLDRVP